jgi:hypothetical protein
MMLLRSSRHIIRLAGAALVACGLLAGAAGSRPVAASPLAPDLRSATPVSATTIRLTWRDTNTTELTGFRVHRYVQGGSEYGPGWKLENIPARKDANGIGTHDATGLALGQTYCFFVYALTDHPDTEVFSAVFSPRSNEICAMAESPYVTTRPRTCQMCEIAPPPPPFETRKLPGDITAQPGSQPPTPPAPTKPDLAAIAVNGPESLRAGITQTYIAEIKNEGLDANGTVELKIIFYGALEPSFQSSFIAAAGLYCERLAQPDPGTAGAIRCAGGTLKQGGTASVAFQARAARAGQGNIVVEINPSRALAESDYDDNRTSALRVEVK